MYVLNYYSLIFQIKLNLILVFKFGQNFMDCCRKSYRAEGFGVFWRGFPMVIARAFPTNGAIFLAYVSCNNIIRATYSNANRGEPDDD